MTTRNFNNTSSRQAILLAGLPAVGTSASIDPSLAATFPPVPFTVRLTDQNDDDDYDLATCTLIASGTLTLVRDYGGTVGQARNLGDRVTFEVSAEDLDTAYAAAVAADGAQTDATQAIGDAATAQTQADKALAQTFPTVYIAAADAPQEVKDAANYVCDGVDDDVQFQAAIDYLVSLGPDINPIGSSVARYRWQIVTSQGFFNLGDTITIPVMPIPAPFTSAFLSLEIRGAGQQNSLIGSVVEVTGDALIVIDATPCAIDFHDVSLYRENLALGWATLTTPIVKATDLAGVKIRMLNCIIEMF